MLQISLWTRSTVKLTMFEGGTKICSDHLFCLVHAEQSWAPAKLVCTGFPRTADSKWLVAFSVIKIYFDECWRIGVYWNTAFIDYCWYDLWMIPKLSSNHKKSGLCSQLMNKTQNEQPGVLTSLFKTTENTCHFDFPSQVGWETWAKPEVWAISGRWHFEYLDTSSESTAGKPEAEV